MKKIKIPESKSQSIRQSELRKGTEREKRVSVEIGWGGEGPAAPFVGKGRTRKNYLRYWD